jgi:hypothetical protein
LTFGGTLTEAHLSGESGPLTLEVGQERCLAPGQQGTWRNQAPGSIELLRIDVLADRQR